MSTLGRGIAQTMASAAEEYRRREEHIAAYCGTPDAAQGCRNILAELKSQELYDKIRALEAEVEWMTPGGLKRRAILQGAIEAWGSDSQIMMAIEEMAELIQALSKFGRSGELAIDMVLEELADARIMLDQLTMIFTRSRERDLKHYERVKLDRLEARIIEATRGKA